MVIFYTRPRPVLDLGLQFCLKVVINITGISPEDGRVEAHYKLCFFNIFHETVDQALHVDQDYESCVNSGLGFYQFVKCVVET